MRWRYAPILSLGLAITLMIIGSLKGGKNMLHNDNEAGIGLPTSDIHHSVTFETATFALG